MLRLLKNIVKFLLYSNLFIAICACFLVIADHKTLNIPLNNNLVIFVGAATLLSYNLHRIIDLRQANEKAYGKILQWNAHHKVGLYFSFLLSIMICLSLSFTFKNKVILNLLIIGLITVLYSLPIQINGKTWKLRNLGISKIFWISSIWSLATFSLVYFQNEASIDISKTAFGLHLIERFLFIFCITLPFDIRDRLYDKKENLTTFATLLGTRKTQILSTFFLLFLSSLKLYQNEFHLIFFYLLIIPLIFYSSEKRSEQYYLGIIDGTIIIYSLVVHFF